MDADVCAYFFVRKENNNGGGGWGVGRERREKGLHVRYSCHVYCTEESLHVKMSLYTMYMHSCTEERDENELYSYCFI